MAIDMQIIRLYQTNKNSSVSGTYITEEDSGSRSSEDLQTKTESLEQRLPSAEQDTKDIGHTGTVFEDTDYNEGQKENDVTGSKHKAGDIYPTETGFQNSGCITDSIKDIDQQNMPPSNNEKPDDMEQTAENRQTIEDSVAPQNKYQRESNKDTPATTTESKDGSDFREENMQAKTEPALNPNFTQSAVRSESNKDTVTEQDNIQHSGDGLRKRHQVVKLDLDNNKQTAPQKDEPIEELRATCVEKQHTISKLALFVSEFCESIWKLIVLTECQKGMSVSKVYACSAGGRLTMDVWRAVKRSKFIGKKLAELTNSASKNHVSPSSGIPRELHRRNQFQLLRCKMSSIAAGAQPEELRVSLFVLVLVLYCFGSTPSSDSTSVMTFLKEFKKLKAEFPGQNEALWLRSGKMLQKHLNKSQPLEPATLILTAAQDGEHTLRCLSIGLAGAYATSLNSSWNVIDGPSQAAYDSTTTKRQVDATLSSGFESKCRAAVLHRIEELAPGSLLILYKYCDHENAAFKNVPLVLTVLLKQSTLKSDQTLTEVEEQVKDFLWEKCTSQGSGNSYNEMNVDKISGVWSRISHLVLPVYPVQSLESGNCPWSELKKTQT
ncbi:torsin-1A-interacting protein 1 [Xenopus laevis]|uniref:Torsin-1A-interacting protein 1 n=1 Tax=Xenopus laevis TaxID=8355 RepID=A0A8J1N0G2_XENLA|nr:torsin-1A-interacting protein 1 [Xenopus laevis]